MAIELTWTRQGVDNSEYFTIAYCGKVYYYYPATDVVKVYRGSLYADMSMTPGYAQHKVYELVTGLVNSFRQGCAVGKHDAMREVLRQRLRARAAERRANEMQVRLDGIAKLAATTLPATLDLAACDPSEATE